MADVFAVILEPLQIEINDSKFVAIWSYFSLSVSFLAFCPTCSKLTIDVLILSGTLENAALLLVGARSSVVDGQSLVSHENDALPSIIQCLH